MAVADAEPIDLAAPLDFNSLTRLVRGATDWLERNAAHVNQLNVFPVPDGDTGTNMLLTMRAAADGAARAKTPDAGAVMRAVAQGAVMGARGNSGVILSQIVAGIARGFEGTETVDGAALARALAEGADTAYRAVTRPVEGTILTVARAAGDGATAAASRDADLTCRDVLEAALAAATRAVARTPEQLPILKQAGVVDAGGEGYRVILEGMAFVLRGEPIPASAAQSIQTATLAVEPRLSVDAGAIPQTEWGYCTQFVIGGASLDLERIRAELQELAASALVVGDEEFVRVHGHTEDPGQLLTYAVRFGRLQRISIEDMDAQHDEWLKNQVDDISLIAPDGSAGSRPAEQNEAPIIATVAVAPGDGIAAVFRSFGAADVIAGGQTMNPSVNDVLQAAKRTRASTVLVLPNNGEVVMTAQQAARVAAEDGLTLVVIPTKTVPEGIAALLAFNVEASSDENATAMGDAASGVRTVEVTRAVRAVSLDGFDVKAGDTLGVLDGKVVAAGPDRVRVACAALAPGGASSADLITLYRGAHVTERDATSFADALRSTFPKASVEVVDGGQPHYDFLISIE